MACKTLPAPLFASALPMNATTNAFNDNPQYKIDVSYLLNNRCYKLWCHAKNGKALHEMRKYRLIHSFWHQKDDVTLTSKGVMWTYPGKELTEKSIQVMVTNLGEDLLNNSLDVTKMLRENDIPTEIYLSTGKLKKQLQYANNNKIPYVIILGEDEQKKNRVIVKNMSSGNQKLVQVNKILNTINL